MSSDTFYDHEGNEREFLTSLLTLLLWENLGNLVMSSDQCNWNRGTSILPTYRRADQGGFGVWSRREELLPCHLSGGKSTVGSHRNL